MAPATFLVLFAALRSIDSSAIDPRCEKMRIPWCLGAYEAVAYPNFFGHRNQEEAYFGMHKLWPLIQSGCSSDIVAYLCRLYAPPCPYLVKGRGAEYAEYSLGGVKPPCEEICLKVKNDCQRVLSEHGLEWPPELDCQRFRNEECHETPTVEVRPTEPATEGIVDWDVETISVHRTTTTPWIPRSRPSTTTTQGNLERTTTKSPKLRYAHQIATETATLPKSVTVASPTPSLISTSTQESSTNFTEMAMEKSAEQSKINNSSGNELNSSSAVNFRGSDSNEEGRTNHSDPSSHHGLSTVQDHSPKTTDQEPQTTVEESADVDFRVTEPPDEFSYYPGNYGVENSDEIRLNPLTKPSTSQCEPLILPSCKKFDYNATNIDEQTQNIAAIQLFYFSPFIEVKCSDHLDSFLCTAYAPPCQRFGTKGSSVPPCKTFCQLAKNGCEELTEKMGFRWPAELQCDKYPDENCISSLSVTDNDEEDDIPLPEPVIRSTASSLEPVTIAIEKNEEKVCETISISACHDQLAYDKTAIPNFFGHSDQFEADSALAVFKPLINANCSSDLLRFLCVLHAPPCDQNRLILPCRGLCQSARQDCKPLLKMFGFPWPLELDCNQFPDDQRSGDCIGAAAKKKINSQSIDRSDPNARSRALSALRQTAPLNPSCEKLSPSSFCRNLYEETTFPNHLNHASQVEADVEMQQYKSLINSECGDKMRPFLCLVYAPVCTVLDSPVPPCRESCLDARQNCERVMNSFGFRWPPHLNCSQYPTLESGALCFSEEHVIRHASEVPLITESTPKLDDPLESQINDPKIDFLVPRMDASTSSAEGNKCPFYLSALVIAFIKLI